MASFSNSVSSVLVIVLLTSVGYLVGALGWIRHEHKPFFTKFITYIAIPCTCINGLTANLTVDMLRGAPRLLIVGFTGIVLMLTLAFAAAKILRLPRRRAGIFVLMCGVSNAIFIGYPMCMELFGEEAIPYVMLYYLCNTSFLQSVGFALAEYSGGADMRFSPRTLLHVFKKPPVIALGIGLLLVFTGIELPSFLASSIRYMSDTVSPLALIYTGFIIYEIGLRNLRILPGLPAVIAFRFALAPILTVGLCAVFGVDGLARSVFIAEMSMPVVTQSVVMAGEFGGDEQFAAMGSAVTTLLTFVAMPIIMAVA